MSKFKCLLCRWFLSLMPNRTKRLALIASMNAYVERKTQLDGVEIKKLNELFDLTTNESALQLPVLLAEVMWSDHMGERDRDMVQCVSAKNERVSEAMQQTIVSTIINSIPQYLRYDGSQMLHDVRQFVSLKAQGAI